MDEFNVSQEHAGLDFDIRRAAVLLPFQVYRLQVLVEAGVIAFPNACFEFADEYSSSTLLEVPTGRRWNQANTRIGIPLQQRTRRGDVRFIRVALSSRAQCYFFRVYYPGNKSFLTNEHYNY